MRGINIMMGEGFDVQKAWHRFLQEVEFAKNYHRVSDLNSSTFRNPIIDYLVPSLLYIKMVALFDEALDLFIKRNDLNKPKKYKDDLNGRISFLSSLGKIVQATELSGIREIRNQLAHELSARLTWNALDEAINLVEMELQHLQFVGKRPKIGFFRERSAARNSDDPDVIAIIDYKFGIKTNDEVTMQILFQSKIFRG